MVGCFLSTNGPLWKLHVERLVQPETRPQICKEFLIRRPGFARHDRRRVTRCRMDQQEIEDKDRQQDKHCLDQPAQYETYHAIRPVLF